MLKEAIRHQILVVITHMPKAIHQQTGVPRILLLRAVICHSCDSNVQSPHMANNAQTNPGGASSRERLKHSRSKRSINKTDDRRILPFLAVGFFVVVTPMFNVYLRIVVLATVATDAPATSVLHCGFLGFRRSLSKTGAILYFLKTKPSSASEKAGVFLEEIVVGDLSLKRRFEVCSSRLKRNFNKYETSCVRSLLPTADQPHKLDCERSGFGRHSLATSIRKGHCTRK